MSEKNILVSEERWPLAWQFSVRFPAPVAELLQKPSSNDLCVQPSMLS